MPQNTPYHCVLRRSNGDGTDDFAVGSFSSFTVTISESGVEPAMIASEPLNGERFYFVADIIPSHAHVEVSQ